MSTQERLSTVELAAFWRVRPNSLSRWRSRSGITMGEHASRNPKSTIYYSFSELDEYHLANLPSGISDFPSTAELWELQLTTEQPMLLTLPEVAAKLRLTVSAAYSHVARNHLPATKPMGDWLVPVPALGKFMARYDTRGYTTIRNARLLTGLSEGTLLLLSQGDDPVIQRTSVGGGQVRLDKKSFLLFLDRHLVNCTVDRWYALRLIYHYEPLLTVATVCQEFHVHYRRFHRLMEPGHGADHWPYLRTPGGVARIPRHVVHQWAQATQRPQFHAG
ncbi:MAG TPA: helix-turn-helix domain-containing protein [Candidatus Saccharimonadales bacterium]|nr:helix-turn-helix domain-containing protein [Candidatus Saccharimonadales bacterium]